MFVHLFIYLKKVEEKRYYNNIHMPASHNLFIYLFICVYYKDKFLLKHMVFIVNLGKLLFIIHPWI